MSVLFLLTACLITTSCKMSPNPDPKLVCDQFPVWGKYYDASLGVRQLQSYRALFLGRKLSNANPSTWVGPFSSNPQLAPFFFLTKNTKLLVQQTVPNKRFPPVADETYVCGETQHTATATNQHPQRGWRAPSSAQRCGEFQLNMKQGARKELAYEIRHNSKRCPTGDRATMLSSAYPRMSLRGIQETRQFAFIRPTACHTFPSSTLCPIPPVQGCHLPAPGRKRRPGQTARLQQTKKCTDPFVI